MRAAGHSLMGVVEKERTAGRAKAARGAAALVIWERAEGRIALMLRVIEAIVAVCEGWYGLSRRKSVG